LSIGAKFIVSFVLMFCGFASAGYFAWDAVQTTEHLTDMAIDSRLLRSNISGARLAVSQLMLRKFAHDNNEKLDELELHEASALTADTFSRIENLQRQSSQQNNLELKSCLQSLSEVMQAYVSVRDSEQISAIRNGHIVRNFRSVPIASASCASMSWPARPRKFASVSRTSGPTQQ
jgi:hypothetical protein